MSRPGLEHRPSSVTTASKTIILVTGGNTGIGYEIVKTLAAASTRNQVLLGCRDTSKGEEAAASMGAPINVNPIQLDITDDKSIEHAFLTIHQYFGKLDVLILNGATPGKEDKMPEGTTLRQKYDRTLRVNVTSQAVLTETLVPVLEKAKLPKVIFVSSSVGSIAKTLAAEDLYPDVWYSVSKTALNGLMATYAKRFPRWKVNAVCPGFRATGMNDEEVTEDKHPKHGAERVAELIAEGEDGVTGTFSNKHGKIPW